MFLAAIVEIFFCGELICCSRVEPMQCRPGERVCHSAYDDSLVTDTHTGMMLEDTIGC